MKNQATMESKIAEVENYFKDKILEKLFEVTEIAKWTIEILIDKKYTFRLWIANIDIASTIKVYSSSAMNEASYMNLNFTEIEQKHLQFIFKNIIAKNKQKEKEKKIAELKAMLNELQNETL